ncbi:MAG: hypothetical protein HC800_19735 [Phormidesmis sp. RL_2_1]|nr:hypothetical protein [Phormidesmis sp. RL_2_1]
MAWCHVEASASVLYLSQATKAIAYSIAHHSLQMINRRKLLFGTATLALSNVLTGCRSAASNALNVMLLEGAVPPEVLQTFRKQTAEPVNFQSVGQMSSLFQQLQRWQQPPAPQGVSFDRFLPWRQPETVPKPDHLLSLGDYWLTSAIAQNLLAPLELPADTLTKLPLPWQQFIRRQPSGQPINPSRADASSASADAIWAAPYKLQALVIVYRQSQFPQASSAHPPIKTWIDLLQPDLREQIALPDHPRIVLGILQKSKVATLTQRLKFWITVALACLSISSSVNLQRPLPSFSNRLRPMTRLIN